MASINKNCFEKNCLCAVCKNICSRCLITEGLCNRGIRNCKNYLDQSYEEYIKENPHSYITKSQFEELKLVREVLK